jgi:thermitase
MRIWLILSSLTMLVSSTFAAPTAIIAEKTFFDQKNFTSPYVSWGIDPANPASINLFEAWKKFKKRRDVIVAVVDTGIDPTHPFLEKNIFVETGKYNESNYGMDFSIDKKIPSAPLDQNGHGTHIAGIIRSIDPDVKILALKYYSVRADGADNLRSTVQALRYAVDNNVDIINYSGGGSGAAAEELAILREAEKKGILVVAAAGNKESNIDEGRNAYYPASYGLKNIITVTAYDESLKILNSSNYGPVSVDIFAPGYRIKSSLQNGRSGFLTGTSQATAFVTGVAALIKSQYPHLPNDKIKELIKASAKKEITMAGKCVSGGRLDAASALAAADQFSEEQDKAVTNRKLAGESETAGKIIYRVGN